MTNFTKKDADLPEYLYRPDDLERFILMNGYYYVEASVLSNPDSLHHRYEYSFLKSKGFLEGNQVISKSTEQHIAEFWKSFYESIQLAGGNIGRFGPNSSMLEVASVLAQNGIRFKYERLQ